MGNLGEVKFQLGDKEEAIRLVEEALEIARDVENELAVQNWLEALHKMQN